MENKTFEKASATELKIVTTKTEESHWNERCAELDAAIADVDAKINQAEKLGVTEKVEAVAAEAIIEK
jgi:hypothetical protein